MRKSLVDVVRERLSPSQGQDLVAVTQDAVLRQDLEWLGQEPEWPDFPDDEFRRWPVPVVPGRR